MSTHAGSAPSSPRAEPPTITVEEHVDALPNQVETEATPESGSQNGVDEVKEDDGARVEPADDAVDTEPAAMSAAETPLPPSPHPEESAPTTDIIADEPREPTETSITDRLDTSNASNKDLPLPPADETTPVEDIHTNEPAEEPSQAATEPPYQDNGKPAAELPTSPEVIVRAPSTDIPPTVSESNTPSSADMEPSSVPPPIPEKVKSPIDRSSAAAFSQHRNASVSSVRTSTPGPGSRPSISSLPDRRSSAVSLASHRTNGSRSFVSPVVFTSALETIAASREAKRSTPFKDSVAHALELVKSGRSAERPREIFEPLRMAVETHNEKLMVTGLDCIGKLVSYGFFAEDVLPEHAYNSPPPSPAPGATPSSHEGQASAHMSLADLVTNTVTSAYTDSTPDPVSLQIVKALLSLVLSPTILVHHSSLLKAVRTVYNVFLLSNDPVNQMVAQGGLTQMVNHVFARCNVEEDAGALESLSPSAPGSRGPQSVKGGASQNASASASVASLAIPQPNANGAEEHSEVPGQDVVLPSEPPSSALNGAAEGGAELEITEPTEGTESVASPAEQNTPAGIPGRL
jgi:brefeldin A-inhibited guanine nucleotide-exchange protein